MKLLTKSNYLKGLQCPKLLWVTKNNKKRISEPDKVAKSRFKAGHEIGVLATRLFEKGIDLSELGFIENIKKTEKSLELRKPLFEAGFKVDNLYSRIDILAPVGNDEWDIIEVKSGTRVKEVNMHDVSFQKYVCEKAGLKIRRCFLMHINNKYIRDGNLELQELFIQKDITEKIEDFSKGIKKRAEEMLKIIKNKEPTCNISVNCTQPYDCPLMNECWKDVAEGSVFEFYRMFKRKCFDLHDNGIYCISDVPEDIKLNDKQKIQRRLAIEALSSKDTANKEPKHVNKKKIKNFLNKLKYPIYYLDFETINPVIPKYDGVRPYQRIPFQFSLHIQEKPGEKLKHVSFLAEGLNDPRPEFLQALKDNLKDKKQGSIVVYNQRFEKGVLKECVKAFPDFKGWYEGNISLRIKDLWNVFKNFDYYDSRQKGSTSIKYVLPVLSDLSYEDMDIKNGSIASLEYERVTYDSDVSEKDKNGVRDALEKYCELDTLAEHEIILGLKKELKEKEKKL